MDNHNARSSKMPVCRSCQRPRREHVAFDGSSTLLECDCIDERNVHAVALRALHREESLVQADVFRYAGRHYIAVLSRCAFGELFDVLAMTGESVEAYGVERKALAVFPWLHKQPAAAAN